MEELKKYDEDYLADDEPEVSEEAPEYPDRTPEKEKEGEDESNS